MQVQQMQSIRGNSKAANQYVIKTKHGQWFQSYDSMIAYLPFRGKTLLGPDWDYSVTTGRYRNEFLNEGIADTRAKIESGEYLISPTLGDNV